MPINTIRPRPALRVPDAPPSGPRYSAQHDAHYAHHDPKLTPAQRTAACQGFNELHRLIDHANTARRRAR